jgi:hypothetical protein
MEIHGHFERALQLFALLGSGRGLGVGTGRTRSGTVSAARWLHEYISPRNAALLYDVLDCELSRTACVEFCDDGAFHDQVSVPQAATFNRPAGSRFLLALGEL